METRRTRMKIDFLRGRKALRFLCAAAFFLGGVRAQAPSREFALKAESPKFWELFEHDASLSKVASGFGFTEGPVWDEGGFAYVSDEEEKRIFKSYADGRKEEVIARGGPDGNTDDRQGRL